ncbi:MAG: outer membrane lipoprotein-sorting protein [Spirochaetes bacterium]|nr:outer membrane lipoprotein-sorting protein [Spirochaetota bacterium]
MKRFRILATIAFIFCCAVAFSESPAEMGTRLMKSNDDRPVFEKVKAKGTLIIYDSSGKIKFTKSLIMGTYTVGMGSAATFAEKYLAYMMSPADDQGNSYLMYHYKIRDDVKWVYLKGIRKAKKVTGADKKLSFFGSDFTNAEASKPNFLEWNYKYIGDEKVEFKGKVFDCYMVESTPKTKTIMSDQGCGRRVSFLEKKSLLTLRLDLYDENMIKVKELRLLSFTTKNNVRGQKVNYETGLEMKNVKTGSKSHLLFSDLKTEEESNLRTDVFTEQYLTQKWW